MMTDFKILDEVTINYKGGKLYLMLIRVGDTFAVEVVDREKTYGRKFASDKAQAILLFEIISEKLSTFKCFAKATTSLKKYLSFDTVEKVIFIVLSDKENLGQKDIMAMKEKINFKLKVAITGEEVKLDIFLSDKKKFCTFTGTRDDNDLVLKLEK